MKCSSVFFKIKNMNTKWQQIHIYQQLNLKNKINKQNRNIIIGTENVLMVARWEGELGEWAKKVKGLRSTNK